MPMTGSSQRLVKKQATAWIIFGAVLFVLGWRMLVMAVQYVKEPDIVRDLCSLQQFEQDLSPNNANTRLVFCRDTEEGVGIYYCDVDGGKPRLLCEQKERGNRGRFFSMLGWSSDDSLFACAWPENQANQEFILIFDGRTGKLLDKIGADQSFNQFAWLSSNVFAYSTVGASVRIVIRQADSSWAYKGYFPNVATTMDNFIAVSADAVAWRDDNRIWQLNINSGTKEKVWETTNRLVEFTAARGGNGLLLNCSDDVGQYLLLFDPQNESTVDLGRISNQQNYVRGAIWTGRGTSYTYLTNNLAGSAFCIKTEGMKQPGIIPWSGGVQNFTMNNEHLFFTGNPDGQTPGIWEYNINLQSFKCIVSSTVESYIGSSPLCLLMTNSVGEKRFYHLWAPPHVSPTKKYPVLLAQELNYWFTPFQIAADRDYYVAVVDRPFLNTWNGNPEQSWVEDVNSLYKIMAESPNIDTTRVYLYACSRETYFLSELLDSHPSMAKGAILFAPTGLPDTSTLRDKRILLVDGKLDGDAVKNLSEFQDRAAENANKITLFLQNDVRHNSASGATVRDQTRLFANFISDGS